VGDVASKVARYRSDKDSAELDFTDEERKRMTDENKDS